MERKFLEDMGLTKEVVDKIMTQNGKDIEVHKSKAESASAERDSLKGQLDTVQTALKKFDGVDVDKLKGEITTLKTDLSTKEADFKAQLSERDFTAMLNAEILSAKGKNPKAVMALLDMAALKSSKNQKEDAAEAIKALAKSDAYLFGEAKDTTPARVSTGGQHSESGTGANDTNTLMNSVIRGTTEGD